MSGSLRHVLAAAVIAVPAIAATPVLGQTDGADGQIAIDATALYMRRAAPDSAPIVSTVPGAGDIANASQISPGWSAAVEGRVGFESGDRWGVEAGGLWIAQHEDSVSAPLAPVVFLDLGTPLFIIGFAGEVLSWRSTIAGAEISGTYRLVDGVEMLAGLRYLQLDEALDLDLVAGGSGITYFTRARNTAGGAQIGVRVDLSSLTGGLPEGFSVGLETRAAALFNRIDATGGLLPVPTLGSSGSSDEFAYLLQAGLEASYEISPGISLALGYQMMWINGIGTVTEQFGRTNVVTGVIDVTTGDVLYHGGLIELKIAF